MVWQNKSDLSSIQTGGSVIYLLKVDLMDFSQFFQKQLLPNTGQQLTDRRTLVQHRSTQGSRGITARPLGLAGDNRECESWN